MKKKPKLVKLSKHKGFINRSLTHKNKYYAKSPKIILKRVFESVNEEAKNESDEDYISAINSPSYPNNKQIKGILALTKENLRTIDFKNKVIFLK